MKVIMWFIHWRWYFKTLVYQNPPSERIGIYYMLVRNNVFGSRHSQIIRLSMMNIIARAGTWQEN